MNYHLSTELQYFCAMYSSLPLYVIRDAKIVSLYSHNLIRWLRFLKQLIYMDKNVAPNFAKLFFFFPSPPPVLRLLTFVDIMY